MPISGFPERFSNHYFVPHSDRDIKKVNAKGLAEIRKVDDMMDVIAVANERKKLSFTVLPN